MDLEREVRAEAVSRRSGGDEEVVGRLKVLEQKVNISEVLLRALVWRSLGVGAGLALENLTVGLSVLPTEPATLGQARHRLEGQMEVIWNIELEVLKEFRENAARLGGTEESEQDN